MPDITRITSRRRQRRYLHSRNFTRRWAWGFITTFSLLITVSIFFATSLYAQVTKDLPSLDNLPNLLNPPDGMLLKPTELYDRTGQHLLQRLDNPASSNSQYLSLNPADNNIIPASLISATLAINDPGFWEHSGYQIGSLDPKSHQTIAQQLVADFLLWNEPANRSRAIRERLLAAQLTALFGREQILTWYLNSTNYGNFAYGADTASWAYFGKPASQLSLLEAAILVATAQAPALNPHAAPQAVLESAQDVLEVMQIRGFISEEQARNAENTWIRFTPNPRPEQSSTDDFISLVLETLAKQLPRNRIERGGLRIITSLDMDLQVQADCAAKIMLKQSAQGSDEQDLDCQAVRLLPTLRRQTQRGAIAPVPQIVILDPRQGQLLAMVDLSTTGGKPVNPLSHPIGTLLTPMIYLSGFTQGLGPASLVWDIPDDPRTLSDNPTAYHGPVRLRLALTNDYLPPLADVLELAGRDNVLRIAERVGLGDISISPELSPERLLEENEVTLLEISHVYSAFANNGTLIGRVDSSGVEGRIAPIVVTKVVTRDGQIWYEDPGPQSKPVISPQLAYIVNQILSDEPARWPSLGHPNSLEIGRPVAAKIGQTNIGNAWVVGYTPHILVGVWLGTPVDTDPKVTFNQEAAALWHAIIQYSSRSYPPSQWQIPPGISTIDVCDPSGLLPTVDCPSVVSEIFLAGNEPVQLDDLYQRFYINRETTRQATVFTPAELIDEQVYMIFPPEVTSWAKATGLDTPPQLFDVIPATANRDTGAQIIFPGMFAYTSGTIDIKGSTSGDGFSYYRLQAGKGLNPQAWILIGEDRNTPVQNGLLGSWDTQGLNGLYAIQLLVVHNDQRVETATTQITIDNIPPEIKLLSPITDQTIYPNNQVGIQASVTDDLALAQVIFRIDGQTLATFKQGPYLTSWVAQPGEHTLLVTALDRAGNTREIRYVISVP